VTTLPNVSETMQHTEHYAHSPNLGCQKTIITKQHQTINE